MNTNRRPRKAPPQTPLKAFLASEVVEQSDEIDRMKVQTARNMEYT